ncbi:MAG: hypothetical protein H0Z37_01635 [Firmicutes bacterium]|nr:hypothetical protein [Bacillota bacterium]
MFVLSTGPIERGANTERIRIVAWNPHLRRPVRVRVDLIDIGRRGRRLLARTKRVLPRRTAVFDADLGGTLRYEVRMCALSSRVLYYVLGYRSGRWWPGIVTDPSTTFRHTDLVRRCIVTQPGAGGSRRKRSRTRPGRCSPQASG